MSELYYILGYLYVRQINIIFNNYIPIHLSYFLNLFAIPIILFLSKDKYLIFTDINNDFINDFVNNITGIFLITFSIYSNFGYDNQMDKIYNFDYSINDISQLIVILFVLLYFNKKLNISTSNDIKVINLQIIYKYYYYIHISNYYSNTEYSPLIIHILVSLTSVRLNTIVFDILSLYTFHKFGLIPLLLICLIIIIVTKIYKVKYVPTEENEAVIMLRHFKDFISNVALNLNNTENIIDKEENINEINNKEENEEKHRHKKKHHHEEKHHHHEEEHKEKHHHHEEKHHHEEEHKEKHHHEEEHKEKHHHEEERKEEYDKERKDNKKKKHVIITDKEAILKLLE